MPMRQLKIGNAITDRSAANLDRYLRDIAKFPLLSIDEEVKIALLIKTTTDPKEKEDAIKKLVSANLRFVVSVAKQYQWLGLSLHDLIDEGSMGLIKAAKRFDPTRGFKFISFAVRWIRQNILMAITEHARTIKIPFNKIQNINAIIKYTWELEQKFGRLPTAKELSEVMNMDQDKIKKIQTMIPQPLHTDDPLIFDESLTIGDTLADTEYGNIVEQQNNHEHNQYYVSELLKVLNVKEKDVMRMNYGLPPYQRWYTTFEIAEKYDMTQWGIRETIVRSIRKIKQSSLWKNFADHIL